MPKYLIKRVNVRWSGGRAETLTDVELVAPFTPSNDSRTKDLLERQIGCERVASIATPATKIG
jgi:hypothetical protein